MRTRVIFTSIDTGSWYNATLDLFKFYHLVIILFFCFVQVTVLRMVDLDDSDDSSEENEDKIMPSPKPAACAKVKTISRLLL